MGFSLYTHADWSDYYDYPIYDIALKSLDVKARCKKGKRDVHHDARSDLFLNLWVNVTQHSLNEGRLDVMERITAKQLLSLNGQEQLLLN